jgi:hypothetical protein
MFVVDKLLFSFKLFILLLLEHSLHPTFLVRDNISLWRRLNKLSVPSHGWDKSLMLLNFRGC